MAKKKKKGAKKKAAKRKAANKVEKPDLTDQEIFDDFGVGTETASLPLRKFISGQRKINGKLYVAIDKILDFLTKGQDRIDADLAEALRINDEVPGEPPACCRGKACP